MLRLLDKVIDLAVLIGGAALLFLTGLIMADVTGRYFGAPITGAQDLIQMTAVFVVFGGMAHCARIDGHIAVDILDPFFPPRLRRVFGIFAELLGALLFALIAWQMWEASKMSALLNMRTNIIGLPRVPFQYAILALSLLASATLLTHGMARALRRDKEAVHGSPKVIV